MAITRGEGVEGKGGEIYGEEDDLALDDGHTMHYTDHVS